MLECIEVETKVRELKKTNEENKEWRKGKVRRGKRRGEGKSRKGKRRKKEKTRGKREGKEKKRKEIS
jgi:hypothetical protein